jgi:hypothetical protein
MNITAKMQVVVDEITLDVTDFLRSLVGQNNDDITRTVIALSLEKYLSNMDEVMVYQVVCDDSNNTPENVDNGHLVVDLLFIVDNISMRANFTVSPGVSFYADIAHEFFVRVNKADLQVAPDLITLTLDPFTPPSVEDRGSRDYDEMPVSLASTLGY